MTYEEWVPLAPRNNFIEYKMYVAGFYMDRKFREMLFGP